MHDEPQGPNAGPEAQTDAAHPQSKAPVRIAVIGGGPAGLAAAFHLTSTPELRERYAVTVYQQGFRLGGKIASSRNRRQCHRIEEHGIHIFGNFYHNIFRLIEAACEELDWTGMPPNSMEELFEPENYGLNLEYWQGAWKAWPNPLPRPPAGSLPPWRSSGARAEPIEVVFTLLQCMWTILLERPFPGLPVRPLQTMLRGALETAGMAAPQLADRLDALFGEGRWRGGARLAPGVARALDSELRSPYERSFGRILPVLENLRRWLTPGLWRAARTADRTRRIFYQLDFYGALLQGFLKDRLYEREVECIDHLNYRDWLRIHGCTEHTLNSIVPQIPINICFQYPEGRTDQLPRMSAASYLQFALRQLLAGGAWVYRFAGGSGEAIITPLYRVLRERGVRFAFFHRAEALRLNPAGDSIAAVDFLRQARVGAGEFQYDPLIEHRGWLCWPEAPLWDQLENGSRLEARGADFEDWSHPEPIGEAFQLQAERDFDRLILATPVTTLPYIARELLENPAQPQTAARWRRMNAGLASTATIAFQIWLRNDAAELGWDARRMQIDPDDALIGANWVAPASAYGDFSDLLPLEDWPEEDRPRLLLYFCGALDDARGPLSDPDSRLENPKIADKRAQEIARSMLRGHFAAIYPRAGSALEPWGLDFDRLVCPPEFAHLRGIDRMQGQYVRANVQPSDRYIVSPPGSGSARLFPWQSGYRNLILAGDWTQTGLNVGSIEGAAISGALAAHAVCGAPELQKIPGLFFLRPAWGAGQRGFRDGLDIDA